MHERTCLLPSASLTCTLCPWPRARCQFWNHQIGSTRGRRRRRVRSRQGRTKSTQSSIGVSQFPKPVDDDHEIVESMRFALESKGYEVLVARDGNQGLALAEREDPDLVILDMMMPKRSGFLVLEKLRRTRPGAAAGDHDHGQRGEPAQGLRRNAGRRRLHPQAVRHGPADGKRQTGGQSMRDGREIVSLVAERQDLDQFRRKNWEGTFEEYLDLVRANPAVTRNAFERVYDMIMSYGTDVYEEFREKRVRYRFFGDPDGGGKDAVFGLDGPLWTLVNAFKSAAKGYGIEKRVLLLHGPVGSSKSTIARLLKKGLERYSGRDDGALYTVGWVNGDAVQWCPMHEEPLHLIPERFREDVARRG